MRAPRLSVTLVVLNAAVLVAAIATVTTSATRLFGRIAHDEALSAARSAAASVVERLEAAQDDLRATAVVLAGRPTLRSLAAAGDRAALQEFLERFRKAGGLDACGVVSGGAVLARAGAPLPVEVTGPPDPRDHAFLLLPPGGGGVVLAAIEIVRESAGASVAVLRSIDPARVQAARARPGLLVRVVSRAEAEHDGESARAGVRNTALADGETRTAELPAEGSLVAVAPLRSAGGVAGVVEASLPIASVDAVREAWVRGVRRIALLAVLAAAALSVVLSRSVTAPIAALTRAAERIGLGDLDTGVPPAPGAEMGTLARTMEEMRLRLAELTGELDRRRKESDAILSGIVEGVFAVDGERRIVYMNPQAERMLGTTADRAAGLFCGDVLRSVAPGGERPCEESCPIVGARVGATARAHERLEPIGASKRSVVVASAPPAGGRQIVVLRDETEIETTRRLRDTVVANISHEFRTPLAAQLASIEMLRDRLGELSPAEARELVLSLERGAVRLTRLIDNLLESVRLEAGEVAIRSQPVALDEVVEEAVESMRPLIEQRRQRVEVDLPHPLPPMTGDATRLTQVFVNLLANANKFGPAGSVVRVGGSLDRAEVTVWIADEGPGLPEGDDELVFGRFTRRAGDEPEQSGMGLGLWIARSIVERHGGRLWAGAPVRGAQLCVTLPTRRG